MDPHEQGFSGIPHGVWSGAKTGLPRVSKSVLTINVLGTFGEDLVQVRARPVDP